MLIKAQEFDAKPMGRQVFNLTDIAVEAEEIIRQAAHRRDEMIASGEAEIAAERARAQGDGFEVGKEQGLEEGRRAGRDEAFKEAKQEFAEQCRETQQALIGVLGEFDRSRERVLWEAEQSTVQLAVAIAEKIVMKAIECDSAMVAENVKAALKLAAQGSDVVIKVNQQDLEYLNEMSGGSGEALGKYGSINIESDDEISPGGCRVCTEQGAIDGTIETQIRRISEQLVMGEATTPDGESATGRDDERSEMASE